MTPVGSPVATSRGFPVLSVSTPRLLLRPLAGADAQRVTAVFADRMTQRWLPAPRDYAVADGHAWCTSLAAERRDRGEGDHYGIIRRADDHLIGCVWARRTDWTVGCAELSFAVAGDARGYGVAPEAIDAISIALLLEHGLQRIELRVVPGNLAARKVAERAGFTYEGLLRNAGWVYAGRVDLEVWSLVAADLRPGS